MLQKNKSECEILERRTSKTRRGFEFPRVHAYYMRLKANGKKVSSIY